MKKPSDVLKFISKFYFDKDSGKVDIDNYGAYRLGLTKEEIVDYLHMRELQKGRYKGLLKLEKINKLVERFNDIAGCNTCAVGPQGQILHYRWDVLRFSNQLFDGTETHFD